MIHQRMIYDHSQGPITKSYRFEALISIQSSLTSINFHSCWSFVQLTKMWSLRRVVGRYLVESENVMIVRCRVSVLESHIDRHSGDKSSTPEERSSLIALPDLRALGYSREYKHTSLCACDEPVYAASKRQWLSSVRHTASYG